MAREKQNAIAPQRNCGVDFMRICAMVMVITHHFLGHGGVLGNVMPFTLNWYVVWFMRIVCFTSVTMFLLASSYYQSKKSIGISGIVRIWLEVWTYSVLCYIIALALKLTEFSVPGLLKALCPVLFRQYGFFNSYILLCFLSPILNAAINAINQKMHRNVVLLLTVLCCVIPYISFVDAFNLSYGEGTLWLILIYFTGAYLQKYVTYKKAWTMFLGALFLFAMQLGIKFMIAYLTRRILGEAKYSSAFIGETPVLSWLASVIFFLAFKNWGEQKHTVWFCRLTAKLSTLIFAVYLIHENNNLKYHLWNALNPSVYANAPVYKLLGYWGAVVSVVMLLPMAAECCRNKLENRIQLSPKIVQIFKKLETKIQVR